MNIKESLTAVLIILNCFLMILVTLVWKSEEDMKEDKDNIEQPTLSTGSLLSRGHKGLIKLPLFPLLDLEITSPKKLRTHPFCSENNSQ